MIFSVRFVPRFS